MAVVVSKHGLSFQEAMGLLRDPEHWSSSMGFEGGALIYRAWYALDDPDDCVVVESVKRQAVDDEKKPAVWWVSGLAMEDGDDERLGLNDLGLNPNWAFVRR